MIYFDKQIQERIDHINFQIKYLNGDEEFTEDIKNEDSIIEAFQKNNLEKKLEFYKEAKKLYENAIKLKGTPAIYKERFDLIREAMIAEINADTLNLFYDEKDVDIKEEFKNFRNNLK